MMNYPNQTPEYYLALVIFRDNVAAVWNSFLQIAQLETKKKILPGGDTDSTNVLSNRIDIIMCAMYH